MDSKLTNGLEREKSHKHYTNSPQELPLHNPDSTDGELCWEETHVFRAKTHVFRAKTFWRENPS